MYSKAKKVLSVFYWDYRRRQMPLTVEFVLRKLRAGGGDIYVAMAFRYLTDQGYVYEVKEEAGPTRFMISQEGIVAYEDRSKSDFDRRFTRGLAIVAMVISAVALYVAWITYCAQLGL